MTRVAMTGLLASCLLLATATSLRAQDSPEADRKSFSPDADEKSPHDYTVSLRGAGWVVWVDGEVKDTGGRVPSGFDFDTVDISDDLGFDDPQVQFVGVGNVRLGRHDFWVSGYHYDESENERVEERINFGGISVRASRRVVTDLEFLDINFRYGYSFFDFEEHGFRLGPTIAVSYNELDLELTDAASGESEVIDETFPAPTFGFHGEVPIGDFVLETNVAGVYVDTDSFDGWGLRANAVAVWRPVDYVGLIGGFNVIYTDLSLNNEDIEAALFGPVVGLELRF